MSAVLLAVQHDVEGQTESAFDIESAPGVPGQADLLTPAALAFLIDLHRCFEPTRQRLLAQRQRLQAMYDQSALPDFRADTARIRDGDWRVAPLPTALHDRRVEITGPVDPKMVINALNSGAS